MASDQKINELLNRGTVEVIVREDLEQKLKSGKKLKVKLGIDPSGSDLHIGHMVVIRKLKEFQDLGHEIILLFGNFTGQIGDPTDKKETRKAKTQEELEKNAEKYLEQVKPVLDIDKIQVRWNADWLKDLNFSDIIKLSSNFTVAQMLERDMFQERIKKDQPISMHEFFYPLMQGYDSVALEADIELGGTDQTFNILAGRTLQKAYGQPPQNVITVPLLEGTDGVIKMGKSEDNYIGVAESPTQMFGKTMSIPDELIIKYFELATNVELDEIEKIKKDMADGANPRDFKMRLASEIISIYHNSEAAEKAQLEFINIFKNQGIPDEIETLDLKKNNINILDLLCEAKMVDSKGDARRMIQGGGVKLDGEKIEDINQSLDLSDKPQLLQVGKRKFKYIKKSA
ncbi:tyrosine--tRNA ligase [Patescibacteria group bacterium]|nr:tyrosine--tRNA ligase [Patescibacteria group bacterium]